MLATLLALAVTPLSVSWGEADITPPEPLPLGGYTERGARLSQPGGDRLYARCLLLRQGGLKVAVTSVEMLTTPESLHREVKARIPPDVKLFLAATHTHCAPDSQMLNERMSFPVPGIASFNRRWFEWYAERIAAAINAAAAQPGREAEEFQVEARSHDGNSARRPGGAPDQTWTNLLFADANIAHYAAHAVFYGSDEMRLRGDWPGAVASATPWPKTLVLVGAIGDVLPKSPGATPGERIKNFLAGPRGRAPTGSRAAVASDKQQTHAATGLRWTELPIDLSSSKPHAEFAKRYGVPEPLAQSVVARFAPQTAQVSAFRFGKVAVVGIPGEPTSHLGRRIRDEGRRIGFSHVLVCSLVNGWMGYILDAKDYDTGGYEATLSFYGREQGDQVAQSAIQALRALAGAKSTSPTSRFGSRA